MAKYKDIMDSMIAASPVNFTHKTHRFYVGNDIYCGLCLELRRMVKTYKKFKVVASQLAPKDTAYLMNKIKELHTYKPYGKE